jgi:hypothetical protein
MVIQKVTVSCTIMSIILLINYTLSFKQEKFDEYIIEFDDTISNFNNNSTKML